MVGRKKSGKTTTVVGLVSELRDRGVRVMTAKHGHGFELDREGSDSWKHRHAAGAERVALAGPEGFAVLGGWGSRASGAPGAEVPLEALVRTYLGDAEVVIAEGFKTSSYPRIEVFRSAAHARPIYGGPEGPPERYLAILSDVPELAARCPVRPLDDPDRFRWLADLVLERRSQAGGGGEP